MSRIQKGYDMRSGEVEQGGSQQSKAWILGLLRRLAEAEAKVVREYERDVPRLGFGQTRGRFPRVRQADDRLGAVHALIDNLIDIDDYGLDDVLAHVEYHRDRGHAQSWEWVHKQITARQAAADSFDVGFLK